jgi:hypothetical protein
MPIATTGKACTVTVDSLVAEGWVTSRGATLNRPGETVAAWGQDWTYQGTAENSATMDFVWDPSASSLGALLEAACAAGTPVTIVEDLDGATRTYTDWLVTSYEDTAPADANLSGTASLIGATAFSTVYEAEASA